MDAGQKLRTLRESLRLSFRDVENATNRLASKYGNDDFVVNLSRLSDIETKGVVPSIFRLYSLASVYRVDYREIVSWYGIPLDKSLEDYSVTQSSRTHPLTSIPADGNVMLPVRIDPGFNLARTTNVGRMIEKWGVVPLLYLQNLADRKYTYGYIGLEDFTMYPLLVPGSFIQVDESRNKVVHQQWNSLIERPIYFVETRDDFSCCWCRVTGTEIILEPHPLSPVQPRILSNRDAEILGQVVGVAMRLGGDLLNERAPKGQKQLH